MRRPKWEVGSTLVCGAGQERKRVQLERARVHFWSGSEEAEAEGESTHAGCPGRGLAASDSEWGPPPAALFRPTHARAPRFPPRA